MRFLKGIFTFLLVFLVLTCLGGIYLCEGALHLSRKARISAIQDQKFAADSEATTQFVEIISEDGLRLRGWYLRSKLSTNREVILIHGQGSNGIGMIPYARLFLSHNYDVLIPDMRAHGASEGDLATYGIKESSDVHLWVDWLIRRSKASCVYGLGESMGAAILLQSLAQEKRFCAIAAECPYSSFVEAGYDRMAKPFGINEYFSSILFFPAMKTALFYTRFRYQLDLNLADAEPAVAGSNTPVLLIHGMLDRNVPPQHSKRILAACTGPAELWEVPDTGHTGAFNHSPSEFTRRVFSWFESHR
jgi:uncharacterized protein